VLAALVGLVVLGQVLPSPGWLGIGCVVLANALAGGTGPRADRGAARPTRRMGGPPDPRAEALRVGPP